MGPGFVQTHLTTVRLLASEGSLQAGFLQISNLEASMSEILAKK